MKTVVVNNLSKSFGKVEALRKISFEVERGEIFGIIGADGAGKSTLFRLLTSLYTPDGGSAVVAGCDIVSDYKELREKVGYMPGRFSLYLDLSVEENLNFFATLFKTTVKDNYELIRDIYSQIEPFKKRRAGALSGGMKQKLALSCALIHSPEVLFLDEPTTGVDPVSRREFWHMLGKLKERGITIVVSTPYMDEAGLCDRMALIKNGEFLTIDTPEGIINSFTEEIYAVRSSAMPRLLRELRQWEFTESCYGFGAVHHITVRKGFTEDKLQNYLREKGHSDVVITPIKADIEDCYMKLAK